MDGTDKNRTLPPELELYLMSRHWGAPGGGWWEMPAALFARVRVARSVYNVWKGYTASANRTKWLREADAGSRELVGQIKAARYTDEPPLTRVERWEQWAGLRPVGGEDQQTDMIDE